MAESDQRMAESEQPTVGSEESTVGSEQSTVESEQPTAESEFTDRELDVMSVLWLHGSGTVAEVREALSDDLGYTSVLKVLQILESKGSVRHEEEGRAYRYIPVVGPQEAGTPALGRILDKIFHGSAELLLARLVSDRDLSDDELDRMRDLLDRAASEDGR